MSSKRKALRSLGKSERPRQLETLESRQLLASDVSVRWIDHDLIVRGTSAADLVEIVQDDVRDSFTVDLRGQDGSFGRMPRFYGEFNSSQIRSVRLDLFGDRDDVRYTIIGGDLSNSKRVAVDLGRGDDRFELRQLAGDAEVPRRGDHEITLRELATHTSGLPRDTPDFDRLLAAVLADFEAGSPNPEHLQALLTAEERRDWDQLKQDLQEITLTTEAHPTVSYSNLGIGLLGFALSSRLGVGYEEAIRERVLAPHGLRDTFQAITPARESRLAEGLAFDGQTPAPPLLFNTLAGAGALRSTGLDLLRYLEVHGERRRRGTSGDRRGSRARGVAHRGRSKSGVLDGRCQPTRPAGGRTDLGRRRYP